MNSDLKTIGTLRARVIAGETISDAELIAGIRAVRAYRSKHPIDTWYRSLKRQVSDFFYWLRYHKEDEANARLAEAAWAEADSQERTCDDY